MKRVTVIALAESALMLALATIMSFVVIYQMPYGGTVTLCSMVPILYIAFRYPIKWALITAFSHGMLQIILGFYPPPARTALAFAGVVLLDYLIAFSVLGLAGLFARPIRGIKGMLLGSSIAIFARFLCHFLSGILIWRSYAPEGQPAAIYSLLYNGSFMLAEWILSVVALTALVKILPKRITERMARI